MSELIIRGRWDTSREPDGTTPEELTARELTNRLYDATRVADRCTDIAGCPLKVLLDQYRWSAPLPSYFPRKRRTA